MHTIDLSGKAALITGGTRNIGQAIARSLAEAGANVALFHCSDEAALNYFAVMLAQDIGPRGIRVNVVSPGYIDYGQAGPTEEEKRAVLQGTALRRLGVPDDVAGAVLFFASDLSAFVTGQWLQVNGGG